MKHITKQISLFFFASFFLLSGFSMYNATPVFADTTSGNLILNPLLEEESGDLPTHWQKSSWGTNIASFTYPVQGVEGPGSKAAQVAITSYSEYLDTDINVSGDAKWFFDPVTVVPGAYYIFSDAYKTKINSRVVVQFTHTNGLINYQEIGEPDVSDTWQYFQAGFYVPQDVNTITIFHLINAVGTLTVDNYSLVQTTNLNEFDNGMVSLTFDDGWRTDYNEVMSILDQTPFRSTHYVITGSIGNTDDGYMTQAEINTMYQKGYDISAHTRNHPSLIDPATDLQNEITGSRNDLLNSLKSAGSSEYSVMASPDNQLMSYPYNQDGAVTIDSMAYPYGHYNEAVEAVTESAGFSGARSIDNGFNDKSTDRYALKVQIVERGGTCDGYTSLPTTLQQVKDWIDTAKATNAWLILVFHQIDNVDSNCYGTTPTMLQSIVDYLKNNDSSVVTVSEGLQQMSSQ